MSYLQDLISIANDVKNPSSSKQAVEMIRRDLRLKIFEPEEVNQAEDFLLKRSTRAGSLNPPGCSTISLFG